MPYGFLCTLLSMGWTEIQQDISFILSCVYIFTLGICIQYILCSCLYVQCVTGLYTLSVSMLSQVFLLSFSLQCTLMVLFVILCFNLTFIVLVCIPNCHMYIFSCVTTRATHTYIYLCFSSPGDVLVLVQTTRGISVTFIGCSCIYMPATYLKITCLNRPVFWWMFFYCSSFVPNLFASLCNSVIYHIFQLSTLTTPLPITFYMTPSPFTFYCL